MKNQEEMIVKLFKKIMAIAISLAMALALCVPAFADNDTGSDTADAPSNICKITSPYDDHEYSVYQIFTGTLSGNVLTDEKWGKNGTGTEGEAVDTKILEELRNANSQSDTAKLEVIKKYVDLDSVAFGTVTKGTVLEVPAGYYLIKDNGPKDGAANEDYTYTTYIVDIVGDLEIRSKSDVPSFEKKIKDTNDTTGDTTGWQDSADYDIGDQVPFQLKGTVAENYADYKTYYFAFHDKEETGLTFNKDSVKVYVDGNLITSGYEVVTKPSDGCTFEVVFENLKNIESVQAGSEITVEYTSELNDGATLGNHGNVNQGKLEFSNNPNDNQEGKPGTGETPWDNVIVFTYKVVVNKVDSDGKALTGAEFTLEKVLADNSKQTVKVVKSEDGTSFTFKGLDDGDYILTETKTPEGYNSIDPIRFTVNANHTITWEGGESERDSLLTDLTGKATTGQITFTANDDKSELATDVVNRHGLELPSTGGFGTTLFFTIGGLLALAGLTMFLTQKRMDSEM